MHNSPVASKRMPYKKNQYTKNVYGKHMTSFLSKVVFVRAHVELRVHQQPCFWRHSLQTGHKYQDIYRLVIRMLEDSMQDLL